MNNFPHEKELFIEFVVDQLETLTEESISRQMIEEKFNFALDYAEDNYLI